MFNQIDKRISGLAQALKIQVMTIQDLVEEMRDVLTYQEISQGLESCAGWYQPKYDKIGLNPIFEHVDNMGLVLLHEIGHSTGRSTRLNRPISEKFLRNHCKLTQRSAHIDINEFHTEELTAHIFAREMGLQLGFNPKEVMEFYLKPIYDGYIIPERADVELATQQAYQAVEYVKGVVNNQKELAA